MFVITLGPGNVDLSIPATMTLAGTVALKMHGRRRTRMILPGLVVAIVDRRWPSASSTTR